MKRYIFYHFLFCSAALIGVVSCNSQNKPVNNKNNSTTSNKVKTTSSNYTEGKDYVEFTRARVLDKVGFSQPVEAFSLLIPKTWKLDGDIMWTPPGTPCAGNNLRVKATSPDGKFIFEMLPNIAWNFDPQLGPPNQSQGNSEFCSYGAPMNAETYFKNVFARKELGNPEVISVNANPGGVQSIEENNAKSRQELMGYGASQVNYYTSAITANVKWTNGTEGIVLCGINILEGTIPNIYNGSSSKIFTTSASERSVFVFPAGERDKATNMLSVIMGSIRTNTAWKKTVDEFWLGVREQSNIAHIGRIKMNDDLTRQMGDNAIKKGQQNISNMDANMRSWEASQQSGDRIHTNFVKAIREVENYRDETGKIELSSGYDHAWSRSDGSSFIMSNNSSFDPSSVFVDQSWKEMQKVE
ncbi:MAG: hypothetical protein H0W62_07985 [Chitinophagales bacterium]|nr:hypothetical protein [Chitinophagales bacterium]